MFLSSAFVYADMVPDRKQWLGNLGLSVMITLTVMVPRVIAGIASRHSPGLKQKLKAPQWRYAIGLSGFPLYAYLLFLRHDTLDVMEWFGGAELQAMYLLGGAALVLAATRELLSKTAIHGTSIKRPAHLSTWVDLYASADPVPNRAMLTEGDAVDRSQQIWNRGSLFGDHTTYWENTDGFTLRIVRLCSRIAGSPLEEHLPPEDQYIDYRARWRARVLRALCRVRKCCRRPRAIRDIDPRCAAGSGASVSSSVLGSVRTSGGSHGTSLLATSRRRWLLGELPAVAGLVDVGTKTSAKSCA